MLTREECCQHWLLYIFFLWPPAIPPQPLPLLQKYDWWCLSFTYCPYPHDPHANDMTRVWCIILFVLCCTVCTVQACVWSATASSATLPTAASPAWSSSPPSLRSTPTSTRWSWRQSHLFWIYDILDFKSKKSEFHGYQKVFYWKYPLLVPQQCWANTIIVI